MAILAMDIGGTKASVGFIEKNNDDSFFEHTSWTAKASVGPQVAKDEQTQQAHRRILQQH